MCSIQDFDGYSTLLQHTSPIARKAHKCGECRRVIRPGEKYFREVSAFDGSVNTFKYCAHCNIPIGWLYVTCGGYKHGDVAEDFTDHAYYDASYAVKRVAVGMRKKWTRRDGALMPVPKELVIDVLAR